jgi:hypothetical protein
MEAMAALRTFQHEYTLPLDLRLLHVFSPIPRLVQGLALVFLQPEIKDLRYYFELTADPHTST